MNYKGKELKSGSDYYAAAMDLMKYENKKPCFHGALALFLQGAELNDRFCICRLEEILRTAKYRKWVDREDYRVIRDVLDGKRLVDAEIKRFQQTKPGVFGVMRLKPVNHEAAMGFQSKRHEMNHWNG